MIYKFKSKATGDRIMLGPDGDQMLHLIGREPASRGIIEVAALPAAITALQHAAEQPPPARSNSDDRTESEAAADPVGLRQRLWPIIDMMRESLAAAEPIVWGV